MFFEERAGGLKEADLAGITRQSISRAKVCGAQQNDSEANGLGSGNHLLAQQIWVVVGLAIRGIVQVVKLTDRSGSSQDHLKKCHAHDNMLVFGIKSAGGVVHRSAP